MLGPVLGPALGGVRVLVTDDSPINLQVARRILEIEGAQVTVASDGQQAVDLLRLRPREVDVVLMDVQMPVMDGLEATNRIRNQLGLKRLPVIALTAGMSGGERERVLAAGLNDFIGKPFDPPDLVRCIRQHVELAAPSARQPAPSRAPLPATQYPADWPQVDGIDAHDAASRLGGDARLFGAMLRRLPSDFADLATVKATPEGLAAVAGRLHALKGSAGTLGAKSLSRLAAQAEDAFRGAAQAEGSQAQAETLLRRVVADLSALHAAATRSLGSTSSAECLDVPESGLLSFAALDQLLTQLESSDLGALQNFKTLSPGLRERMGADAFGSLAELIDNLQFPQAASALRDQPPTFGINPSENHGTNAVSSHATIKPPK